jgi:molybdenum cofactor guanylyltransferase
VRGDFRKKGNGVSAYPRPHFYLIRPYVCNSPNLWSFPITRNQVILYLKENCPLEEYRIVRVTNLPITEFSRMVSMEEVEVFILAGGKSSRMGEEKGLVNFRGKPLIAHLLETVTELPVPVSVIGFDPRYGQFGLKVYQDIIRDKGPMGGLYTALNKSGQENVLLLSCDMSFLSLEVLRSIIGQAIPGKINCISVEGRINPVVGVYPKSIEAFLKELMDENKLKMQDMVLSLPHQLISMDEFHGVESRIFTNINSMEDLRKWED